MADTSAPLPPAAAPLPPRDAPVQVVLVEDDHGDTVLFEAMVGEVDPDLRITSVGDLPALFALDLGSSLVCVVLDLGLPGMSGFEALDQVVARAPSTAIVVLTGRGDRDLGIEAVARGAQDYLAKGQATGPTIARSVRFAVERKRSQLASAALASAQVRQSEQHRLERALLVEPAVQRADLTWRSRYIAARAGALSGDFFDGVELPDGTIRLVIGDVAGHGPDEAALGVSLRAGWRSLTLTQMRPEEVLLGLEEFLEAERPRGDEFATVCDLTICPSLRSVCVRSAGHPPPVLAGVGALDDRCGRSPLGIHLGPRSFPGTSYDLPASWSLVTYTDGLFEVRDATDAILTADQVVAAVQAASGAVGVDPSALVDHFAARATSGWRDDVAVLVVNHGDLGQGQP